MISLSVATETPICSFLIRMAERQPGARGILEGSELDLSGCFIAWAGLLIRVTVLFSTTSR